MPIKKVRPEHLVGPSADSLWERFNDLCNPMGIGIDPKQYGPYWTMFFAGYLRRHEEVLAAMA